MLFRAWATRAPNRVSTPRVTPTSGSLRRTISCSRVARERRYIRVELRDEVTAPATFGNGYSLFTMISGNSVGALATLEILSAFSLS
jgi:hypothetical protein